MRETKFRGKSKSGYWVTGYLYVSDSKSYIINKGHYTSPVEVFPESIGQFTGLQDVNGRDIYEGDIAELSPKKYICVVEYSVRDTRFILKNKNGYQGEFALIASAIKVIGNIYENPELLQ